MFSPIFKETKHYGNNRWFVFSPRLNREVCLNSDLEFDHYVLIEMNHKVADFCEYPFRIHGEVDTIPDMWIKWNDGVSELREIKYSNDLDFNSADYKPHIGAQINSQKKWCSENNQLHSVYTELEIRANLYYLKNMKQLFHYLTVPSPEYRENCNKVLDRLNCKTMSFSDIYRERRDISETEITEAVARLVANGIVTGNFDECLIGSNTRVWCCAGNSDR